MHSRRNCWLLLAIILIGALSWLGFYLKRATDYVAPTHLISQIASADHVVVTNLFAGVRHDSKDSKFSFSMTITGQEMREVIHAMSLLQKPKSRFPEPMSSMLYEWQLQFYRGTELLGTADLSDNLVLCDGGEYNEPLTLERLYYQIVRKSGEGD